jgi:hypothetical protein
VLAVSTGPNELQTETVEEFISISDGQVGYVGSLRAVQVPRHVAALQQCASRAAPTWLLAAN